MTFTYSKTVSLARNVIKNVETYEKASTGTHSYATLGYVFSKMILNIGSKEIGVKNVPVPNNPTGTLIDERISEKDYKNLCKTFVNSIDKNNKCPPYLTYGKHKIAPWVWTYATARILVYAWEKKNLPSNVLVSYKAFRKTDGDAIKYGSIVSLARNVIKNVEAYKKPYTGKYDTNTLGYIFAKSVLAPKESVQYKKVASNPNAQLGTVNGGIGIENFKKLAQLYINWVNKNKQAPAYLVFNKDVKVGVKTWTYESAKAIVYYKEHNAYPQKVDLTYKTFYVPPKPQPVIEEKTEEEETPHKDFRKYGHAEDYGCDDMGQNTPYYCGCHSLQEVFRNLTDTFVYQDTIAEVCGTTSDGTDHDGLNTCVAWFNRNYGFDLDVDWKNFSELGWDGIRDIVYSDDKDCVIHNLYRDQYGHYEVVNWVSDDWVGVQNSLGDGCSRGCYCGYKEDRTQSEFRSYISGISQKSVMVITNR